MPPPTLHERFDLLRFPLIVLVIYVHNAVANAALSPGDPHATTSPALLYLSQFWSQGVAAIAVPLFFVMSGYLFFYGGGWSLAIYREKLHRRVHTLLMPYLFWNIALFAAFFAVQSAGFLASANVYYPSRTIWENAAHILGLTPYPVAFQFWFIRDLILLVVFSPLIYVALRVLHVWLLTALAALWALALWPVAIPGIESLLFFSAGALLAIRTASPFPPDNRWTAIALVAALALIAIATAMPEQPVQQLLHKSGVALGVAAALGLSAQLAVLKPLRAPLLFLAPTSFFVFAMHEPLQRVLREAPYLVLPANTATQTAVYIGLPLVVAALCVALYLALERIAPRILGFISGARRALPT